MVLFLTSKFNITEVWDKRRRSQPQTIPIGFFGFDRIYFFLSLSLSGRRNRVIFSSILDLIQEENTRVQGKYVYRSAVDCAFLLKVAQRHCLENNFNREQ